MLPYYIHLNYYFYYFYSIELQIRVKNLNGNMSEVDNISPSKHFISVKNAEISAEIFWVGDIQN